MKPRSRLLLLLLSVVALALLALATCRRGDDAPPPAPDATDAAPADLDMFAAWREAREAMRLSPDHLPARAEALVAEGDAEALFAFVRDQVQVYPPSTDGFAEAIRARRWGSRATLRGGAGTPREKVELLAGLLQRAGFEVRRLWGEADPAKIDGRALLLGAEAPAFAPAIDDDAATRWRAAIQPPARERSAIDPDGSRARALAAGLARLLPDAASAPFDFSVGRIPLLEVKIDGEWRAANPIGAPLALGDPGTLGAPQPDHSSPMSTPEIRVTLEAARSDAPYRRFPLVSRSFSTEDVAGRRIHVGFSPPVPAQRLARMDPRLLRDFVPVIGVVGHDLDAEASAALAASGDILTLGGDVIVPGSEGPTVNGQALAPADPGAPARVARIATRVQAAAFPQVRVAVEAVDAEGRPVDGLAASDFALAEDGQARPFTLLRNAAPPPRVVLLFDVSSSMPEAFRGDASMALAERLVDALYAQWPAAGFQVATISYGASLAAPGWAMDHAAARARLAQLRTTLSASEIWTALDQVQQLQPTLVILVSDGDTGDTLSGPVRDRLGRSAPVFSIAVGEAHRDFFAEVSRITGGSDVAVADTGQAVAAILDQLARRQAESVELVYEAPREGPARRSVRLAMAASDPAPAGEGAYDVPGNPSTPRALSGLYLTLSMGGSSHTVTLAGHALPWEVPGTGVTAAELEDVRGALLGRVLIAVEGAAPKPSVLVEDWILDKLALEPLWQAVAADDEAAMVEAWSRGLPATPGALALAHAPLPGARGRDGLTFEATPRLAAMIQKLVPDGRYTRQLSYFPLSRWRTAADDPRRAWTQTLEATAGLAVVEAALLPGNSTLKALEGRTLQALAPAQARLQPGLDSLANARWAALAHGFDGQYWRLLAAPEPDGAWSVHLPTGSMIGLLPDGTGGSAAQVCDSYRAAKQALGLASVLGSAGGAGPALGVWGALAKWEIDHLTMAILVIGHGAEAGPIRGPAGDVACSLVSDGLGRAIPRYGDYTDILGVIDATGIDAGLPDMCSTPEPCG